MTQKQGRITCTFSAAQERYAPADLLGAVAAAWVYWLSAIFGSGKSGGAMTARIWYAPGLSGMQDPLHI